MASLAFLSDLEEDLICPLCYEQFLPPRNPKELSCPHVYCQVCLVQLIEGGRPTIVCPECRLETSVPHDGIQALKTNLRLRNLAEKHHYGKNELLQQETLMQTNEQTDKLKTSKKMSTFSETTSATCSLHAGEPVKLFCTKCKMVICQYCLLEEHKLHSIEKLEVMMKSQDQVQQKIEQKLNEQIQQWESYLDLQKHREANLHTAIQIQRAKMKSYIDSIRQELERQSHELMQEMRWLEQPQYDAIKHEQQEAKNHLANLKANVKLIPKADGDETNYETFMHQLTFASEIEQTLSKLPPSNLPSLSVSVAEFYPTSELSNIKLGLLWKEEPNSSSNVHSVHHDAANKDYKQVKDIKILVSNIAKVDLQMAPKSDVKGQTMRQDRNEKQSQIIHSGSASVVSETSNNTENNYRINNKPNVTQKPLDTATKPTIEAKNKKATSKSSQSRRKVNVKQNDNTNAGATKIPTKYPMTSKGDSYTHMYMRQKSTDSDNSDSQNKSKASRSRKTKSTKIVTNKNVRNKLMFQEIQSVDGFQGAMKIATSKNQIVILQACTYEVFKFAYHNTSAKYKEVCHFSLCKDFEPRDIVMSLNHNFFIVAHSSGADMYSALGERTLLYNSTKRRLLSLFSGQEPEVISALVNCEDLLFLGKTNNTLVETNILDGATRRTLKTPTTPCFLASSGKFIAMSNTESQEVCVMDIDSGNTIFEISVSSPRGLTFHNGINNLMIVENNPGISSLQQYSGITGEWISTAEQDMGKGGLENDVVCISPNTLAVAAMTSLQIFSKSDLDF